MPRRLLTCLTHVSCVLDFAVSEAPILDRRTHSRRMDSTQNRAANSHDHRRDQALPRRCSGPRHRGAHSGPAR
jgi:hypothetical protein